MRPALIWCVVVGLAAAAWAQAPDLPPPQPVPEGDEKSGQTPKKDSKAEKSKDIVTLPPVLFPGDPFPPPAPPVKDPRTKAWEQAHMGYVVPAPVLKEETNDKTGSPETGTPKKDRESAPVKPPEKAEL